MFIGVTTTTIDLIRKAFPDGCDDLANGLVIFFRLEEVKGEDRLVLGLGAIEPEYVDENHSMEVAGRKLYFSVPSDYISLFRKCILHFNHSTSEFETLEVFLPDK